MLSKITSGALLGIDAVRVDVEVDVSLGMQVFHVVGLPDGAVRESRLRIPSALNNAGYSFPVDRITVNLAPADMRKDGTAFDVAIALGILMASREGLEDAIEVSKFLFLGELGLDGRVRPIRGALSLATMARDEGLQGAFVPKENAVEAATVLGLEVYAVSHIRELVEHVRGTSRLLPTLPDEAEDVHVVDAALDLGEVCGQETVKRALEVAAAGGHNVLLVGPPGSGKSMLARRLPTILPQMTFEEALETTKVYSVTGQLGTAGLCRTRPFRSPHHTISDVGLVGGGSGMPRPGELSLAHNGVLFLDELPEFKKSALEVMRQPLEDGSVTITRSLMTLSYPSRVMLVAAMNPCPCGYHGSSGVQKCTCSADQIQRYRAKLSGPLLDRLDLQLEVPAVPYAELRERRQGEGSVEIRARVTRARALQRARFADRPLHANAQMRPAELRAFCEVNEAGHALLARVIDTLGMSARAYDRILKVARTCADLEGAAQIEVAHIAEAVQYRALDRELRSRRAA